MSAVRLMQDFRDSALRRATGLTAYSRTQRGWLAPPDILVRASP